VGQLDAGHRPRLPDAAGELGEARNVLLGPDAQVKGADPALGQDRRGLHHHQPHPAQGPGGVVEEVPVRDLAFQGGRVLAHGGHGQAVFEAERPQLKRVEKKDHAPILTKLGWDIIKGP